MGKELLEDIAALERDLLDLLGDCPDAMRSAVISGDWIRIGKYILTAINGPDSERAFATLRKLSILGGKVPVVRVGSSRGDESTIRERPVLGKGKGTG
jgi:hypothetical protein